MTENLRRQVAGETVVQLIVGITIELRVTNFSGARIAVVGAKRVIGRMDTLARGGNALIHSAGNSVIGTHHGTGANADAVLTRVGLRAKIVVVAQRIPRQGLRLALIISFIANADIALIVQRRTIARVAAYARRGSVARVAHGAKLAVFTRRTRRGRRASHAKIGGKIARFRTVAENAVVALRVVVTLDTARAIRHAKLAAGT